MISFLGTVSRGPGGPTFDRREGKIADTTGSVLFLPLIGLTPATVAGASYLANYSNRGSAQQSDRSRHYTIVPSYQYVASAL